MQSNVSSALPVDSTGPAVRSRKRMLIVYMGAIVSSVLLILFIFMEPLINRFAVGVWQRGHYVPPANSVIDFHATAALTFLVLIILQVSAGYLMRKAKFAKRFHTLLGRFMVFAAIPVFGVGGLWVVFERVEPIMLRSLMWLIIAMILYTMVRGYVAIRRRNIEEHIDWMMAAFVIAGGPALFRLFYFLIWQATDKNPFTFSAVAFVAVLTVYAELLVVFWLAGRLRKTFLPILVVIGINLLSAAVLPWDFFKP